MIGKLKGKVEYVRGGYAVIDVAGVGYKVFTTPYNLGKIAGKKEVELFIHTHVKEDILALYGFLTLEELEMFELLISISGVGPKSGMGILTVASPKTIQAAILNEDSSILTKVSGVGKKTAERVILELQNKMGAMSEGDRRKAIGDTDAIDALVGMDYTVSEARDALKTVPKDVKDIREKIKRALKGLGK